MYRENRLKRLIAEGRPVLGCWLGLADPMAAECIGLAGYDCVMIDHEHGPGGLGAGLALLQALSGTQTTALMRVPWNDPVYIKRVLDMGVEGIMVPMIDTAGQAQAVVSACRYPPQGIRGAAYDAVRAADYGLVGKEYLATANDRLMVICQIESARAVEAVPDIAKVPGVDMLFLGPNDLSGSIGKLGRYDDPEVAALVARAERAILDSGKPFGTITRPGRSMESLVADGCKLVLAGSDLGFVRDGAKAQVQAFRAAFGSGEGRA